MFLKALALRRRILGEDHSHTATSYNNLALLLKTQGKYTEAEPLYQKSLDIRRRTLGEDHSHTAIVYETLSVSIRASYNNPWPRLPPCPGQVHGGRAALSEVVGHPWPRPGRGPPRNS